MQCSRGLCQRCQDCAVKCAARMFYSEAVSFPFLLLAHLAQGKWSTYTANKKESTGNS